VLSVIQNFQRNRCRPHVPINEEHFLFGADSRHPSFEATGCDHVFERTQILKQRLHIGLRCFLVKLLIKVGFAHWISENEYLGHTQDRQSRELTRITVGVCRGVSWIIPVTVRSLTASCVPPAPLPAPG